MVDLLTVNIPRYEHWKAAAAGPTERASHLLSVLVADVLSEVVQLLQRRDGLWRDAVRHGAQDVTQILVLLQQELELLHPVSLLLLQGFHLSADVLLLLEHADATLLLRRDATCYGR